MSNDGPFSGAGDPAGTWPPLGFQGYAIALRLDQRILHIGKPADLIEHLGEAATSDYEYFSESGRRAKLVNSMSGDRPTLVPDMSITSDPADLNDRIRAWFSTFMERVAVLPANDPDRAVFFPPWDLGATLSDAIRELGPRMGIDGELNAGTPLHNLIHRLTGTH